MNIRKIIIAMFTLCLASAFGLNMMTNVFADNESEADRFLGKWYSIRQDGYMIDIYDFKDDGTLTYVSKDVDGQYIDTYDYKYELKENILVFYDEYGYEISSFTYTFDGDKLQIKTTSEEAVVTENVDLYRTEEAATENNPAYKMSDRYLSQFADEKGFVIEDGVLLAYFGHDLEVTIPDNVHTIASSAFESSLKRATDVKIVVVPGNVKTIETHAFWFSTVQIVILEEGVEELGDRCFEDAYLTDVYIPESVNSIGKMILETEEAYDPVVVVHCVEGSAADEHFKNYTPYTGCEVVYDYEKSIDKFNGEIISGSVVLSIITVVIAIGIIVLVILHFVKKKK